MNKNLDYTDEALLLQSGFKYGLTFQTLWKEGSDGKLYCCSLPDMAWHYLSETGLTLPATESRRLRRSQFKELFE